MKLAALASLLLHAAVVWLAPAVREETLKKADTPPGVFYIGELADLYPPAYQKPEPDGPPAYSLFISPEPGTAVIEPPAFAPEKVREARLPDIGEVNNAVFNWIPIRRADILNDSLSGYETGTIPFEERVEP